MRFSMSKSNIGLATLPIIEANGKRSVVYGFIIETRLPARAILPHRGSGGCNTDDREIRLEDIRLFSVGLTGTVFSLCLPKNMRCIACGYCRFTFLSIALCAVSGVR